jgi:hypothetical protein
VDLSVGEGGQGEFELQTTERSKSVPTGSEQAVLPTVSVQCNSDEVVTGGGFAQDDGQGNLLDNPPIQSKKQDNGWSVTWSQAQPNGLSTVYAECLKVVEEETTG